jgi:hypothetical protein
VQEKEVMKGKKNKGINGYARTHNVYLTPSPAAAAASAPSVFFVFCNLLAAACSARHGCLFF